MLATTAHNGRFDKAGKPEILHPLQVMFLGAGVPLYAIPDGFNQEELMSGCALHDVVEDTQVTLQHIRDTFGNKIADTLDALSRRKQEPYKAFIYRLKPHPLARIIKRLDLQHNLSRAHSIPDVSEREKLVRRWESALTELEGDNSSRVDFL
jgi:(p)ppGpp synthase/HD superfamily hydrolase